MAIANHDVKLQVRISISGRRNINYRGFRRGRIPQKWQKYRSAKSTLHWKLIAKLWHRSKQWILKGK